MNTQPEIRQFGLALRSTYTHGTRYITAHVVSRKQDRHAPYGVTDFRWEWPKHLADFELDGLGIYGFVSTDMRDERDGLCTYIGDNVEYRDVFCIDGAKAGRMVKTLRRIGARLSKDRAYEPGDRLYALARVLKLDFIVEDRFEKFPRDNDLRYLYHDLGEGRNRFRAMIEEARKQATEARYGKVTA